MAICRFCSREFISAQAVRAHLKGCQAYLTRPLKPDPELASLTDSSLGKPSLEGSASREGNTPAAEFDPVRQLEQRIAAEQLRLKLRELAEAHRELDLRTRAREREQLHESEQQAAVLSSAEREREIARSREQQALREREQKEQAQRQFKARRRDIIQDVKREVVDRWIQGMLTTSELKAQILQHIEEALVPLPVDELPREELIQIAQGVRDRLHAGANEAQEQAMQIVMQQQSLSKHGLEYALRELRDIDGLDLSTRWQIEARVRKELQQVVGDETLAEIEDWMDEILEQEGLEYDYHD